VFSQWELMLRKAAEVVEGLDVGYTMLHGNVPGKDRRALLEQFRDDAACRVFLSTDAGGTGLNLQAADTVINLEVPWNPAVLEQRIARVHRMGQHRPVQVFNLVVRDSIEERVLRTLEQKRSLFTELFLGTSEEVIFDALGQQTFLETVRELFDEEPVRPPPPPVLVGAPGDATAEARQALVQAGIQFLEALAAVFAAGTAQAAGDGKENGSLPALITTDTRTGQPVLQVPLPSTEVLQRGARALQTIVQGLSGQNPSHREEPG
jgi:hypothetical protein